MTRTLKDNDYFATTDIALCAALCAWGFEVVSIDKHDRSRATFLIQRESKLDEIIELYFSHRLSVEPLAYFNYLKELKTRIYHI